MNKKTIAITSGTAILAGFLGMGAGYASADGLPDVQTKTVTKTVPGPTHTVTKWKTKRVEVPGPTQVKWRTKTVTKQVTPQSCLDAIDDAENIARDVASFTKVVAHYPKMVGEAYKAGINMDGARGLQIAHHMNRLNVQMQDINGDTEQDVAAFNSDKGDCRSH